MPNTHDLEKIHELCRLRTTLEAFAATRLHSLPHYMFALKKLQKILKQLHTTAKQGSYPAFHKIDMQFHRELVTACDIPPLLKSWEIVMQELDTWTLNIKHSHWASLMSLYREHIFLIEALQSNQLWIAEQAIHQHVEAGWYRIASASGKTPSNIDPVDRAASFISTHFTSKIEIGWIARNVSFISTSHLTRLFRQKLGTSPQKLLRQVRLEHAAELLSSKLDPIPQIAKQCGYKNVSHFIRHFHQKFCITPKQYRTQHLKNCPA